jgi:transposase-like protein
MEVLMKRIPKAVYTKEFREEALKLAMTDGVGVSEAARRVSISMKTLANWVRAAKDDRQAGESRANLETTDRDRGGAEPAQARVGRSEDGARSVKKVCNVLREGVAVKYGAIEQMRQQYPVSPMCRFLGVSTSGYYAWRKRPLSLHAQQEFRLEAQERAAHERSRQTFGPERLQKDLANHGVQIRVHRIKRLRTKLGLRCKQKRKFKATTYSTHNLPAALNILDQDFSVSAPNQAWCGDITLYLIDEANSFHHTRRGKHGHYVRHQA